MESDLRIVAMLLYVQNVLVFKFIRDILNMKSDKHIIFLISFTNNKTHDKIKYTIYNNNKIYN